MKNLVFDVFSNNNSQSSNSQSTVLKMNTCRGWSRITIHGLVKASSCRGWSRITLYIPQYSK